MPGFEVARNVARHIALKFDEVRKRTFVSVAPNNILRLRVDQFDVQNQLIASLDKSSVQYRLDTQLLCDRSCVGILPFVSKDRRTGLDRQTWNLRKAVY